MVMMVLLGVVVVSVVLLLLLLLLHLEMGRGVNLFGEGLQSSSQGTLVDSGEGFFSSRLGVEELGHACSLPAPFLQGLG